MTTISIQTKPSQQAFTNCLACVTRGHCIIKGLSDDAVERLQPHIRERSLMKGDRLELQGSQSHTLMVIKVGMAMGLRETPPNPSTPVCVLGRGRLLGFNSLFGQPAPLCAVAFTRGRVCEFPIDTLYNLGLFDRAFRQCVYRATASYIENLANWASVMRAEGIRGQLTQALKLMAEEAGNVALRLPSHVDLARLLSTRRETIARHLNQLEADGVLLRVDRWHCSVNVPKTMIAGEV